MQAQFMDNGRKNWPPDVFSHDCHDQGHPYGPHVHMPTATVPITAGDVLTYAVVAVERRNHEKSFRVTHEGIEEITEYQ